MINRLLNWLDASTCNVMAVETIKKELDKAGFAELRQTDKWEIRKGGKYYVTKNGTAIFAFVLGAEPVAEQGFRIISAHSDSPCFKIKPNAEIYGDGGLVTLNVEKYGGGILYTWFDRPLSMSGRVVLRSIDPLKPTIVPVDIEKPFATIPHLAIHFNRAVNEGNALSVQKDMKPVVGRFSKEEIEDFKAKGGIVRVLVAEHLGIDPLDILEYELNLYPVEKSAVLGVHNEFFQSARIDDLSMAYAALEALLEVNDDKAT
ncbi:MAG: M18 family aminopeptidase, partial [Muribaculaceae bacterium]|nr:M18 family aminopeptidase [Muribaculaceae bacterium]